MYIQSTFVNCPKSILRKTAISWADLVKLRALIALIFISTFFSKSAITSVHLMKVDCISTYLYIIILLPRVNTHKITIFFDVFAPVVPNMQPEKPR